MDTSRHERRVVVITGAGSGIGLATASRFAREGAAVMGCDVSEKRVASATAAVTEAGNGEVLVADVSSQEGVDRLVGRATEVHGRIDVIVNNAGTMDAFLPAADVDDATWRRVMGVNLDGPMMLTRAVVPGMVERGSGSIVNVASVRGLKGGTAGAAYTASKHGLVGLTRSVAWYYGQDEIRCNAVCPGGGADQHRSDPASAGAHRPAGARPLDGASDGTTGRDRQPDLVAGVGRGERRQGGSDRFRRWLVGGLGRGRREPNTDAVVEEPRLR